MEAYPMTTAEVETDPAVTTSRQDIASLPAVPPDSEAPAEVEPTGPTVEDDAWWAEQTRDDSEWDRWIIEGGPEPEIDLAVLMGERWTLSGWPTDEDCLPARIG